MRRGRYEILFLLIFIFLGTHLFLNSGIYAYSLIMLKVVGTEIISLLKALL